jgi:hypothetical protein
MDQEMAYLPIDDYGLIGNCYTAALISSSQGKKGLSYSARSGS